MKLDVDENGRLREKFNSSISDQLGLIFGKKTSTIPYTEPARQTSPDTQSGTSENEERSGTMLKGVRPAGD